MKRKAFIVLFGAVLLLMATALTEYLFYRQDENTWVERFESRLHEQERKADHLLATFRDSVDIDSEEWEEDLIFVGIREGSAQRRGQRGVISRLPESVTNKRGIPLGVPRFLYRGQGFLLDERNYRRSAFIRIADQWEKFYEDRKYLLRNPEEKI